MARCELGKVLLAATKRGICAVILGDQEDDLAAQLRAEFPAAILERNDVALAAWLQTLLRQLAGHDPLVNLSMDVRATAFQQRVWEELRRIPPGETRTYQQIATAIGQPTAARAVARACATNPIAILVPCHRVVGADGSLTGYRWGLARKRQLLATERAACEAVLIG